MSTQRAARARLRSITSCQTKDTVTGFDIRLRRTPLNAAGGEGGPDSYTGRKKKQLEDGKRSRSFSSESTLNLLEADGKLTQAIRETVQRDCDTPHATATSRTLYILHNNTKHVQHQGEMNSILLLFHFTTDEDETLERKLSGDPGKLPEGLWVSLPQNWNIFPPTGALISESVKYSALLTHLSRADRVEEQGGRRGVESLNSRESAGPNPWMNVVIITVSRSHMLTETLSFFHHSCLKWDREWDTAAEACKQNRSYQKHVIFKFNLLLNFMC